MKNEKKVVEKKEVKKNNGKKGNFFKNIWIKIKEMGSELKKITWPSFGKVLKQTGVVIAVVLFFLVVVTAIDFGLTQLLALIK